MFENTTAESVKKVGRPKKVAVVANETEPTPKKRGRPPKITLDELELGTPPKKSVSVKTPKTPKTLEPRPKKVKELTEEQIQKLKLKEEKRLLKE